MDEPSIFDEVIHLNEREPLLWKIQLNFFFVSARKVQKKKLVNSLFVLGFRSH